MAEAGVDNHCAFALCIEEECRKKRYSQKDSKWCILGLYEAGHFLRQGATYTVQLSPLCSWLATALKWGAVGIMWMSDRVTRTSPCTAHSRLLLRGRGIPVSYEWGIVNLCKSPLISSTVRAEANFLPTSGPDLGWREAWYPNPEGRQTCVALHLRGAAQRIFILKSRHEKFGSTRWCGNWPNAGFCLHGSAAEGKISADSFSTII